MIAIFVLISALGIFSSLGTILSRNLIHAALYLIAFFFTIACQFVLLEAEFLAALQVLVYIGAVSILMMFGIMLTRNIQGDEARTLTRDWKIPALFAGFCLYTVLLFGMSRSDGIRDRSAWTARESRPPIEDVHSPRAKAVNDMARGVGVELMTRYAIAFEVAGLLLTASLVGAIALAHREEDATWPERTSRLRREVASRKSAENAASGAV